MANEVVESSVQIKNKAKYWNNTIFRLGAQYDIIPKWWSPSRDAWFRGYWYQENFLASAVYAIANRNAAFGWELTGLASDIEYAQNLLQFADFGSGWQNLMIKSTIDELTQDNGFFWEVIRPAKVKFDGKTLPAIKEYYESDVAEWFAWDGKHRIALKNTNYTIYDSPLDLAIGISHLDAGQCRRTGDAENPVVYTDRHGKQHLLKYWQAQTFNEMPSPIEKMNNVGHSALTRVFRASHIMQSIALYNDEKISGRFNRAVFLTNIDPEVINDAISMANSDADNRGLIRYSQPIVATTLDPGGTVSLETINLAEIPDNFNFNDLQNWYIANLALALGVDFGFLAPLPGKGLGTASQSETMAKQAKGKSSRLFMDMISNALNFKGVLPQAVQFKFVEQDTEEEERVEKIRKQRADRHKIYVEMGFTTPTVSQQMLSDAGDIPPIYLEQMGQEDTTPAHTVEGDTDIETQEAISEEESEVEEKQHQHITIEISESSKNLAHKFVHNLPYGKIKARQQILFKKLTVFERLKNAAQQAFGKKQIEVPEINNPELEQALSEYGIELDELVTRANTGTLTQNQFEEQLAALVTLTLTALYSETSGLEPDNFTDQDADNLEDFIAVNLDSVKKLADDIYDGRYQPTEEDEDRAAMLLTRMGMWLGNALGMAYIGLLNNPTKQERKITWKLGIAEHCPTCIALDGQVHTIQEWWDSNFYPRNEFLLLCHGFNCKCRFDDVPNSARTRGSFAAVPTQ